MQKGNANAVCSFFNEGFKRKDAQCDAKCDIMPITYSNKTKSKQTINKCNYNQLFTTS